MKEFLETRNYPRYLKWVRFFVVFFLAIFATLALSTEIVDVLETYFYITLDPKFVLCCIALAYMSIVSGYFLLFQLHEKGFPKVFDFVLILILLFGVQIIILSYAYFVYYRPDFFGMALLPGELERIKGLLAIIVSAIIMFNALLTSWYDLRNRMNQFRDWED